MSDGVKVWVSNKPKDKTAGQTRAEIVGTLIDEGMGIHNNGGNATIEPKTIQKIFNASDAFVFGPDPTTDDRYLASCFLACLTKNDVSLTGKPVIIVNSDHSWDPLIHSVDHFVEMGVGKNKLSDIIHVVNSPGEVPGVIREARAKPIDLTAKSTLRPTTEHPTRMEDLRLRTDIPEPKDKVVVYCSASLKADERNCDIIDADAYKESFKELGRKLAQKGIGIVYGGGCHGLMGALAEGAKEANGWVEAVTLERFFSREGLPNDVFSKVHFAEDVHQRVQMMAEIPGVKGFVMGPGTEGTLHEIETKNHLLCSGHQCMDAGKGKGVKPVYFLDLPKRGEQGSFWGMAREEMNYDYPAAHSVDDLMSKIDADKFSVKSGRKQGLL